MFVLIREGGVAHMSCISNEEGVTSMPVSFSDGGVASVCKVSVKEVWFSE